MGHWPTHPRKELEGLLREFDEQIFGGSNKRSERLFTITYNGSYVTAVAHADGLVIKASDLAGIRYANQHVVDADGLPLTRPDLRASPACSRGCCPSDRLFIEP